MKFVELKNNDLQFYLLQYCSVLPSVASSNFISSRTAPSNCCRNTIGRSGLELCRWRCADRGYRSHAALSELLSLCARRANCGMAMGGEQRDVCPSRPSPPACLDGGDGQARRGMVCGGRREETSLDLMVREINKN
ncbi:unnamed protein product [Urochloa humidicola]